jgi:hypothetical protein
MPVTPVPSFVLLEEVMDLARALVADTLPGLTGTPGEGQILTDDPTLSPFTLKMVNSALRSLYRDLGNGGVQSVVKDNVLVLGLTPVNSASGVGNPNPAVQVNLSLGGYFDGLGFNYGLTLPSDCITMLEVWERQNASGTPFTLMRQVESLSSRYQGQCFGEWEWRNDSVWMNGATTIRDVKLRYSSALPLIGLGAAFGSTYIPIPDCTDYLSFRIAYLYTLARDAEAAPAMKAESELLMNSLRQRQSRQQQGIVTQRIPYGAGHPSGGYGSGYNGGY